MIRIAIPSRSRATLQKTIHNLSSDIWPWIHIVVPGSQYAEYRANIPAEIDIFMAGDQAGVREKRAFILNMTSTGKVIMMDDDLRFYRRSEDGKKFPPASRKDTIEMVEEIERTLDIYPMVGLTDKFMSQTKPRGFVECQRFNQVLGFNRDLFPHPWPKFRIQHDEEHDIHLQFLTRGHKTAVITEWSKGDYPNSKGGCSEWRTPEVLRATHQTLMELWPGIVSITPDPPRARYNWRQAKSLGNIA